MSKRLLLLALLVSVSLTACKKKSAEEKSPDGAAGKTGMATTAVATDIGDPDYLNPVISSSAPASNAYSLMFSGLVLGVFDTTKGFLVYKPSLAKRWEVAKDNMSIVFYLRNDVKWTDGQSLTAQDFKFTYDLIGDTIIASSRQAQLEDMIQKKLPNGETIPDVEKSIEVLNDSTVKVNFQEPIGEGRMLFQCALGIVPKHIYSKVDRKEFKSAEFNEKPLVTCGPFKFEAWKRKEEFSAVTNPAYNLPAPAKLPRFMIRNIPDYTSRLTQLKTGAVDVVEAIKPEDAIKIEKENPEIEMKAQKHRIFSYMMISNIDPDEYQKGGKIKPNAYFGTKKTRQALVHGIDRESVLQGFYYGKYAQIMASPISPAFKWAVRDDSKPHKYDPALAKKLLAEDGWKMGSDGILEKNGKKFSFTLHSANGAAAGAYMAPIIQRNLKELGIDMKIQMDEGSLLLKNTREHKFDAALLALSVQLEVDLSLFGSDLKKYSFNSTGYQNKRVDELQAKGIAEIDPLNAAKYWKEFQDIFYDDVPFVPLFWTNRTVGYNKRIQGTNPDILSVYTDVDVWTLQNSTMK
jgi:peptide/nickel transport system substrate-binding protein